MLAPRNVQQGGPKVPFRDALNITSIAMQRKIQEYYMNAMPLYSIKKVLTEVQYPCVLEVPLDTSNGESAKVPYILYVC